MNAAQGLQQLFAEHRDSLLRYLRAHGAGEAAEDCLQDLWLRIAEGRVGPIANPRSYFFRMATNLMIDRRRAESMARRREQDWTELVSSEGDDPRAQPDAERQTLSRQQLEIVEAAMRGLPPRALSIFRRHRIDGRSQREIAREMGLSPSTIESDLRLVYRQLLIIKGRLDEE